MPMHDHWIDVTYLRFVSICGLHACTQAFSKNNSTQVPLDAEALSLLQSATLGGGKASVYPLLCRAIQRTLDFAASHSRDGQGGLVVRDTAYHDDCEIETSNPSATHSTSGEDDDGFHVDREFGGPEPTYTTNPPIMGTCDLSLYRRRPFDLNSYGLPQGAGPRQGNSVGSSADLHRRAWLGRKSWSSVHAFISIKLDSSLSPFSMDIDDPNFLPSTQNARRARTHLVHTAGEIMRRQHRCFLYSVFIVGAYARLIRWERSGAVVSEPVDLREAGGKVLAFVYALGCVDDCALGCDPTATLANEAEMRLWHDAVAAKLEADADWKDQLGQTTDGDWPIYKLRVSIDDASTARRRWLAYIGEGTPLPSLGHQEFLVGRQSSEGRRSPFRRGCKGFIALDVTTGEFVHLKDFWHADAPERPPEFVVYARLMEAGVRNIPTFLCGGYVSSNASGGPQTTMNHTFDGRLQRYTHGRFVVREVGRPLESYENSLQLATVFQQALTAHQDAWENAGLLHGDINHRSIVIYNGRGLLADWGLAKNREDMPRIPAFHYREGTWRYMSGLVCRYPLKPYELSDDLESFIRVFIVLVLRFHKHCANKTTVRYLIRLLDSAAEGHGGVFTAIHKTSFHYLVGDSELFCEENKDEDISPNLITLFQELNALAKQHNQQLSGPIMRPFRITVNLSVFKNAAPANPDYVKAHEDSPLYTHAQILKVLSDAIHKDKGWVKDDKSTVDFFADIQELASYPPVITYDQQIGTE